MDTIVSGESNNGSTKHAALVPNHTSEDDDDDEDDIGGGGSGLGSNSKSRRELPNGAVATLKSWLLSPEHFTHPYPTPQDQIMLMTKTGIDKKQLKNWFTNARRRIWKPMLKKQLEAGKLAALGAAAAAAASAVSNNNNGHSSGGMMTHNIPQGLGGGGNNNGGSSQQQSMSQQQQQQQMPQQQEMYNNFQQASQHTTTQSQQQQQQYDQSHQHQQQYEQNGQQQQQSLIDQATYNHYGGNSIYQQTTATNPPAAQQNHSNNNELRYDSIGSLAPLMSSSSNNNSSSINSMFGMIKTDSHAVLMELFARDQDLVRQAAAGKAMQAAAAAAAAAQGGSNSSSTDVLPPPPTSPTRYAKQRHYSVTFGPDIDNTFSSGPTTTTDNNTSNSSNSNGGGTTTQYYNAPSLSSWPHFSSVSSLNNLGGTHGLHGVKSITNLSAADLSSQGNLNKMVNLAQVKSIENMGKFDSFAFLEVFFDDKSGMTGNQSYSTLLGGGNNTGHQNHNTRGIKRERDDQDDAIGLSLDGDEAGGTTPRSQYNSNENTAAAITTTTEDSSALCPPIPDEEIGSAMNLKRAYDDALAARGLLSVRRSSENLRELDIPAKMQRTLSQEYIRQLNQGHSMQDFFSANNSAFAPQLQQQFQQQQQQQQQFQQLQQQQQQQLQQHHNPTDPNNDASVEVPSNTNCMLCVTVNVDTQLRPCGHMFHGRCLKPMLANTMGPPTCPICYTPTHSAILAVPTATTESIGGGQFIGEASSQT